LGSKSAKFHWIGGWRTAEQNLQVEAKFSSMQQSRSSSSTILLIIVLVLTAPLWLAIGGVIIGVFGGLLGGLFGAFFGILGGLLAAFFGLITLPFTLVFGSFDFLEGDWFLSDKTMFMVVAVILLIAVLRRRQS
jgi:hypothetical protein